MGVVFVTFGTVYGTVGNLQTDLTRSLYWCLVLLGVVVVVSVVVLLYVVGGVMWYLVLCVRREFDFCCRSVKVCHFFGINCVYKKLCCKKVANPVADSYRAYIMLKFATFLDSIVSIRNFVAKKWQIQ